MAARALTSALAGLSLLTVGCSTAGQDRPAHSPATDAKTSPSNMPLSFVENHGQVDGPADFYVHGASTSLFFAPDGVTFSISQPSGKPSSVDRLTEARTIRAPREHSVLKLEFVGASRVEPSAGQRAPGVVSYLKGSPDAWRRAIPTYQSIAYRDLWPGVDLVYSGTGSQLKYSFVVHPGADPDQIRLAYRGTTDVSVNGGGQLVVRSGSTGFTEDKPYTYQVKGASKVEIDSRYVLESAGETGTATFGIPVGSYDKTRDLVIDPTVFIYAGYIGGGVIGGDGNDDGSDIAVDDAGNAYIVGSTDSTDATFPVTVGPDLTRNDTSRGDAFVAKVRADGTGLEYAGYIGGDGGERGMGIAVDSAGAAYVVGHTDSTEATFPRLVGPDLTAGANPRAGDAFITKVTPDGTSLEYSGYIAGDGSDFASGVAVDAAGFAYVTGNTTSLQNDFPTLVGPDLTNSFGDAFVTKVAADGSGFVYSGFIGGDAGDFGEAIAVDPAGNAYITGTTTSKEASFPVTVGPDLTRGDPATLFHNDGFVVKVTADGTGFAYAGYVGGDGLDFGTDVDVDASGAAYLTGRTRSTEATFPVNVGPDVTFNGLEDAYVAKVRPDGTGFAYAGYLGAGGLDIGFGIAVDQSGNAYVAGETTSKAFPSVDGPHPRYNGGTFDGFITKVNPSGDALVYSGFIGGRGADHPAAVAVDAIGNAYVTGRTDSERNFPGGTRRSLPGPDRTFNGGASDAFVVKVGQP